MSDGEWLSSGVFASILQAALTEYAGGCNIQRCVSKDDWWIRIDPGIVTPAQGWKLHVSAGVPAASDVLSAVLPVLLRSSAKFKLAATMHRLAELNANAELLEQAGKFITVYPGDDAAAVNLATALDSATRGLRGPAIRTDRQLHPGSLVHYRYGSFTERYVQTETGRILLALRRPDGKLAPDQRESPYLAPDWVSDPFVAAGVVVQNDVEPLVRRKYRISQTLHDSPRGSVMVAVDRCTGAPLILKSSRRDALMEDGGTDARDRLRAEAQVLGRLDDDKSFPRLRDLLDGEGDLILGLEFIPGTTLQSRVREAVGRGVRVPEPAIVGWGIEIAGAVTRLHSAGYVYRDLKASNVMIRPDGQLVLLDFEIAHNRLANRQPVGRGTPGYTSPQQAAGQAPSPTDDVYSFGALLFFVVTGADPSAAPNPGDLLERPIATLNPTVSPLLAAVIVKCLNPDPARRFSSMNQTSVALKRIECGVGSIEQPPPATSIADEEARSRARETAASIGDRLRERALNGGGGSALVWTADDRAGGSIARNLDTGLAGIVVALAELAAELNRPLDRQLLKDVAERLRCAPRLGGPDLPGLFVGEAGIGVGLLRAGQVLDDSSLIADAERLGRWIAEQPHTSPDLFAGTAGRLRFHLWLWAATSEMEHLQAATSAGRVLLGSRFAAAGCGWTGPAAYGHIDGKPYIGYARGAAGVADCLLDLFEVTADERLLSVAFRTAQWIAMFAETMDWPDGGINWPTVAGGPFFGPFWCHGATGVGTFMLHLAGHDPAGRWGAIAADAARATCRSGWSGPGQCHGLAGSIEYLVAMWQATRNRFYLDQAHRFANLLEPFLRPSVTSTGSSYSFGLAGALLAQLRLADPDRPARRLGASSPFAASQPGG